MPRLNQTQTNLITKAAITAEFCSAVIRDLMISGPNPSANPNQNLLMLEDHALSLALFIREYRRVKNPVERKGQRA